MPVMPPIFRPRGQRSKREARAEYDRDRGTAHERGYGRKWQKARLAFLMEHPLCVKCAEDGRVEAATVVDHIEPHRGDQTLFWSRSNWQALCKPHHDGAKQREERRARRRGA